MSFLDDIKAQGEDLLKSVTGSVAGKVDQEVKRVTGQANAPRSEVSVIAPNYADAAAKAFQNFGSSQVMGISVPVVLAGVLGLFLVIKLARK